MPPESVNPDSSAKPLRVLLVEDNPRDVKLTVRMLEQAGYRLEFATAATPNLFEEHLTKADPQIIICDYNLRDWTAMDALEIFRGLGKDIPFVILSGTLGDEAAAECIKKGATDYVLKDRMARLPSVVARALEETATRSARKRAQEDLDRFFMLSPNLLCIAGFDGYFKRLNPAWEKTLGFTQEELLGEPYIEFVHPDDRKPTLDEAQRAIAGKEVASFENRYITKDGSYRSLLWNATPLAETQLVYAAAHDITEHKRLLGQLLQAQKMESVGKLAGGVAHDFNNLLTVISGYCHLMLGRMDSADPQWEQIDEIKKAGDRAAALTRQLLAFSRQQVLEPQVLDLNAVVANLEKMLRRLIGEDIELEAVLGPELGRVKADAGQIEQIIMNLAVNSRDAMPKGGKLTIETSNVDLDETYARKHVAIKPGPYVMLAVSDTGIGMDTQTQSHIFEPFFTTKELGKGTGLGLSTVYGIVKQSGGYVWVYSEPGRGATFKAYFPRVEERAEVIEPRKSPSKRREGTETILLVEDEETVQKLARRILESNGYTVLVATRGDGAFRICEEHKGTIHLLLTDVVMPQMSGREVANQLALLRKGIKVLYMSGYTDDAVIRHGMLEPGTAFLQKPFTPESLLRKVREVLDG